ncbi:MAG: hypothetical protein HW396_1549 [Candidatus Dadabacteria bacterium]|nr:hypothetical protein [Candidatus Dadabacteria bacterium]
MFCNGSLNSPLHFIASFSFRNGFSSEGSSVTALKGFDTTNRAEQVLRRMSIEAVGGQRLSSGKQLEAIRRNDKVQVARFAAHRAIALRNLQLRRRDHLKSDTTTVTTAGVCDHAFSCRLTVIHLTDRSRLLNFSGHAEAQ